jgi:alpha-D-xyloside xylohydrolase
MRQVKFFFTFNIIIASIFLSLTGYAQKPINYHKDGNSIIFDVGKAKLSISILDTAIMQVKYTLSNNFDSQKSLIIEEKKWQDVPFKVKELDNAVIITTASLKVTVNRITGAMAFYNNKGQLLLKENDGNARKITPTLFDGFSTNIISQQFQSAPDEAIYGLGQHQDQLLDIKGYDLDFFQHNMEVYIPFLVSTKGYGLLWNNLSYSKFGNPDAIHAISASQMFDDKGMQGGLSVKLYKDSTFKELLPAGSSISDSIAVSKKDTQVYAARFNGSLLADKNGEYCFYSYAD